MKNENLKNNLEKMGPEEIFNSLKAGSPSDFLKTITDEEIDLIKEHRAAQARKKAKISVSSLDELIPERIAQNEKMATDYKKAIDAIKELAEKVKKNGTSFYKKMRRTLLQQGFKSKTYSVKDRSMADKKGYVYIRFNGKTAFVANYLNVDQDSVKIFKDNCDTWFASEWDMYPVLRIKASAYEELFEYEFPFVWPNKENSLCIDYIGGMSSLEVELVGPDINYDLSIGSSYPLSLSQYPKYREWLIQKGRYKIHKDKVVSINHIMKEFMKMVSEEVKTTRREVKELLDFCDESLKDIKEKTAEKWWLKNKEE